MNRVVASEPHESAGDPDSIESRVLRQRDSLLMLTNEQMVDCEALGQALGRILEVTSATLQVHRVSIWRYNEPRTAIDCVDLYDAQSDRHSVSGSLHARDFPNYFRAIAASDIVAVADACEDPRTAEFTEAYLRPLGIVSMMDVPIHLKGAVIGVLCHEHTAQRRNWTADEKSFAIAVSNLISLAFERYERHRAEATLLLQGAALNAAAHAIVITDRDARIAWVNPAFTQLTGYRIDEAIGKSSVELLSSGHHDQRFFDNLWSTLLGGDVWRGEIVNRRKNGTMFLAEQTVTPVKDAAGCITHFVAIKNDLTEQRSLEAQFMQAQKMEIVGRLTSGVAHDFNNMLTVINGTAELSLSDLPNGHLLRPDFERIQEAGIRAAALTRQLLAFCRKHVTHPEALAVGPMLTGVRGMLQRLIGEDIRLDVRVAGDGAAVRIDPGQFEQVIFNLAVNARDAMPRGGPLRIESSSVDLDESFVVAHPGVTAGPHVRIAVTDAGQGMSQATLTRIFEPFFTTKESGKGTGLGLSLVYGIVQQSRGTIAVSSEIGRGTTFEIYLPRIAMAQPASGDEALCA